MLVKNLKHYLKKNQTELLPEQDKKMIAEYNEYYKTRYTSVKEVENNMVKIKLQVYDKIKNCITGNYEFRTKYILSSSSLIITDVYTIKDKDKSGNCHFEIAEPTGFETITPQPDGGRNILNCYVSDQDLNYFNNEQAKNDTILKAAQLAQSKLAFIISKSCKPKIIYPKNHQLQANIIPTNFPKELVYNNKPIDPYCMYSLWDSTQSLLSCQMPLEINHDLIFENGNQSLLDQNYIGYTYRDADSINSLPYVYYKILNKISPAEFLVHVLEKDFLSERISYITIINRLSKDQIKGSHLTLPLPICTNSTPTAEVNTDRSVTIHYKASLSQLLMNPLRPAFNEDTLKIAISTVGPLKEEPHDLCMVNVDYNFDGRQNFYDFRNITPLEIDKITYSPQNIQYYECLKRIIKDAAKKPLNKTEFDAFVQTIKSQCSSQAP